MADTTTPATEETKSTEGTPAPATAEKVVTGAADKPVAVATVDTAKAGKKASDSKGTTLDSDTTKPSTTKPGDGPADTTNPNEVASTVPANPSAEALQAGTVNAVAKVGEIVVPKPVADADTRFETFTARGPKGESIKIRRNIETGASERVDG